MAKEAATVTDLHRTLTTQLDGDAPIAARNAALALGALAACVASTGADLADSPVAPERVCACLLLPMQNSTLPAAVHAGAALGCVRALASMHAVDVPMCQTVLEVRTFYSFVLFCTVRFLRGMLFCSVVRVFQ